MLISTYMTYQAIEAAELYLFNKGCPRCKSFINYYAIVYFPCYKSQIIILKPSHNLQNSQTIGGKEGKKKACLSVPVPVIQVIYIQEKL